jgi:hypothetical protein
MHFYLKKKQSKVSLKRLIKTPTPEDGFLEKPKHM